MRIFSLFIVADSVWKWIRHLGGPGLILLGLADNTSFISAPTGSGDVFLSVLSAHQHEWWAYYAFMATSGRGPGAILNQAWEVTKVRAQAPDARRRMSSHGGGNAVRPADLNAGARPFHAVT